MDKIEKEREKRQEVPRLQVHVETGEDIPETVITIRCRERTPYINKLIAALKIVDRQIVVTCEGNITSLSLDAVLYIESVDRKCFVYTEKETCESDSRLYELEEQLKEYLFVRISKSAIVNLKNIKSIRTYINRRLLITLNNGEQLIASRQYADAIRKLLDTKGKAD